MTAINTVKHFKDLGLEFVEGDDIAVPLYTMETIVPTGGLAQAEGSWPVNSFAWRANTGKKPAFKGLIEAEHRNKDVTTHPDNHEDWSIDNHSGTIIKWRPLLNDQPTIPTETPEEKEVLDSICGADDKPINAEVSKSVFTQAMVGNGEQIEVGMMFSTKAGIYTAELTNEKSVVFTDENGFLISLNKGFAKPILTPRELAIADLVTILEKASELGEDYVIDAEAIYDAGYRK